MKIAYNPAWLHNLNVVKEAKQWLNQNLISKEQFALISSEYRSDFYHPNFIIRILLFIAALIALLGVTGLFVLMFDGSEVDFSVLSLIYGVVSWIFFEMVFVRNYHHYKSGVSEALLYHSAGFVIGGISGLSDFNTYVVVLTCLIVFSFCAFRYLDLISTAGALGSLGYLLFFMMFEMDGFMRQIIPFVFIALFTPLYFYIRILKARKGTTLWLNCLTLMEALSLLVVYAAGNYLVVRELSVNLMNNRLAPGQDIPFAFLFYFLTVSIPVAYLYFAIKNKDIVLLRVSLLVLAFSVFTFKYYYSLGHPEFTFTASGAILLGVSLWLFRYLKTPKHGFTRDNILKEKWADSNPEAFIIAQTLGGNKIVVEETVTGSGGASGGGGSSESW